MKRLLAACITTIVLAGLAAGCGRPAVLTREDGSAWNGQLAVGQTMTVGCEIVDRGFASYDVEPGNRISVDNPALIAIGGDKYGFTLAGLAPGETTLHVYAPGDAEPADFDVVVK